VGERANWKPLGRGIDDFVGGEANLPGAHADATAGDHGRHRGAAASGQNEQVPANLDASARSAITRGGHPTAAALFESAARLTPDGPRQAHRLLEAAEAHLAAGAPRRASFLLAQAQPQLSGALLDAQAKRLEGAVALALGELSGTTGLLVDAARALEPLNPRLARATHLEALEASMYEGALGGRDCVPEAAGAALAAPPVPGSQATDADLLLEGFSSALLESYASGAKALKHAIERIQRTDDSRWMGIGYLAAFELWDDAALHALSTRRVRLARDTGRLTDLRDALNQLGMYQVIAGQLDVADGCFEEASAVSAATGAAGIVSGTHMGPLLVACWRGDEERARGLAENCMRDATARGAGAFIGLAYHAVAVLDLALGRYEAALQAAQEASVEVTRVTRALPSLVEAATRCGENETAAAAAAQLAERTLAGGTEWGLGTLARSRALVSEERDAECLYEQAIEHLKRCRARPELARARLLYGEWLRRQGRRRSARNHLKAAHEMSRSMGMEAFAERAATELLATGERVRRRRIEERDLLTPQEDHIARLASEGRSNPEIAGQLFISPRTVEYHLHKVFRKLGVGSRMELVQGFPSGAPTAGSADTA
jgi:DNA-binding CsgD family transcriptional regulator